MGAAPQIPSSEVPGDGEGGPPTESAPGRRRDRSEHEWVMVAKIRSYSDCVIEREKRSARGDAGGDDEKTDADDVMSGDEGRVDLQGDGNQVHLRHAAR